MSYGTPITLILKDKDIERIKEIKERTGLNFQSEVIRLGLFALHEKLTIGHDKNKNKEKK